MTPSVSGNGRSATVAEASAKLEAGSYTLAGYWFSFDGTPALMRLLTKSPLRARGAGAEDMSLGSARGTCFHMHQKRRLLDTGQHMPEGWLEM
jgi:hypothetical protein